MEENGHYVYSWNIDAFMHSGELDSLENEEVYKEKILRAGIVTTVQAETCSIKRVYVSILKSSFRNLTEEQQNALPLGFVSSSDLPFNLSACKAAAKFPFYSDYLHSHSSFHQPGFLSNMMQSLSLDPYKFYSLLEGREGFTLPEDNCIDGLKSQVERKKQVESNQLVKKAEENVKKQDYLVALSIFEDALKLWKRNTSAYELRGKMYIDLFITTKTYSNLKKACFDFENAMYLNPDSQVAKEYYSKTFIYVAERAQKEAKYEKALEYAKKALEISKENHEAKKLLNRLSDESKWWTNCYELTDLKELEKRRNKIIKKLRIKK